MKNTYKNRKGGFRCLGLAGHLSRMSRRSLLALNICLPIILLVLIAMIFKLDEAVREHPETVTLIYHKMLEYIIAALAIAISGALLLDAAEKKDKK